MATVILLSVITSVSSTENVITDNLDVFRSSIQLGSGGEEFLTVGNELESGSIGGGLATTSYSGETIVKPTNAFGVCNSSNNNVSLTINLGSSPDFDSYKIWLRVYKTVPAGTYNPSVTIDGQTAAFSISDQSTSYEWVSSTDILSIAGGSYPLVVTIPCSNLNLQSDKVLITSALSCVPLGDGSNCE